MTLRNLLRTKSPLLMMFVMAAVLALATTAQAESKKSGKFGKALDYDWEPSGGDPSKGPGLLDNATIRVGNSVIRTGNAAQGGPSASEISRADRARKARQMNNRSVDSTTPR